MKVSRVVVGYDGSANAQSALEVAVDLVASDGVVHVVTAYESPTDKQITATMADLPEEFKRSWDPRHEPRETMRHATEYLDSCEVNHHGHVIDEDPATAILNVAEDLGADMIVVGSRGIGRGQRFLRGSVSAKVAAHAKTSFIVVQHGATEQAV